MAVGEKTNILDSLNIKEALKLAKRKAKEGQFTESINICNNILERYPLNKDCRVFIKTLPSQEKPQLTGRQDPSSSELSSLIVIKRLIVLSYFPVTRTEIIKCISKPLV